MVEVRIEKKPSFIVSGKKIWISGQDNSLFAKFWEDCNSDGTVERLKQLSEKADKNVTKSLIFGVSRVEKDPSNRAFDFYICSECENNDEFESFVIPECEWAIFRNTGDNVGAALIEAEMYCHMDWLNKSEYKHAFAPEIEVYPYNDNSSVEYWLPIVRK